MVTTPNEHVQKKLREWDMLSPIDPEANDGWHPAPRLHSPHGKVGGFLGNRKNNADGLLLSIKELLDRRYELQDTMVVDKYIYSKPAAEDIIGALADRCDFVVTAIAD